MNRRANYAGLALLLTLVAGLLVLAISAYRRIDVPATRPNAARPNAARPNILVILTDDQGYHDV